ncbi:DNA-binding response regulator [Noviherbaspirillum cavernae]|uniref:DNA-binding response regulator n=1 Tax=Noviherbaspirillum cavernae TaxID=2320862 RepID=A0A418WYX8_9BURK|nr:response regulator transcription factor [Noviherbaspirillum cavernae]RJG05392.1 DNA-binding response regulator [Noviherbaspirillum cavernae]
MKAVAAPIALVEDNDSLRTELAFHLTCAGHAVTGLADGAALDLHLATQPCRLVVLDLGLPGEDGLSICARLRQSRPEIGIVMLTARGMAHDRLAGLQGGADAYLVKPAPAEELLAVITNLLRRLAAAGSVPAAAPAPAWIFNQRKLTLTAPNGEMLTLTHAESLLLQTLQRNAPEPASRRQLVEALGGNYLDFAEHRLEVAISRLRRKLSQAWPEAEAIRAARGVGYLLTQPCLLQNDE